MAVDVSSYTEVDWMTTARILYCNMYRLLYILDLRFALFLCTTVVWQFTLNAYVCTMLLISSSLQGWRHEETVSLFLSVFNISASINCLKIMTTLDDANKQHYITLCSNNACSKLLTVLLSCLCYMLHNMRTTLNMHVNLVKDWFTALTSIKNSNSHYAGQTVMASIYRNK